MTPNVHIEVLTILGQQLESVRASGDKTAPPCTLIEAPVAARQQEAA
jgi:hypothetical protein